MQRAKCEDRGQAEEADPSADPSAETLYLYGDGDRTDKRISVGPGPKPNALALLPKQVDIFLAKTEETAKPGYAMLFQSTAGSASRIDEARHYESGDIDVMRGMLTVMPKKNWTTKGYRYRDVPISKNTIKALLAFVSVRGTVTLDDKAVWNKIQRVRKVAKLPKFSIHDLQRAWASTMHSNGASLKQVSVWLGHSAVQVTKRYIRNFEIGSAGREFLLAEEPGESVAASDALGPAPRSAIHGKPCDTTTSTDSPTARIEALHRETEEDAPITDRASQEPGRPPLTSRTHSVKANGRSINDMAVFGRSLANG